uniref:PDZ domain-containing protein n=1 Tax=Pundamilia nyererei TaxID=303518 RepID=A0A3B4H0V0_9CICH
LNGRTPHPISKGEASHPSEEGLGIKITGGRGSKRSPHGIIITHIEEGGAIYRDGRLHAGDELLMINNQSLVGLTHQEAVDILRSATGLVQLVVASRVSAQTQTLEPHLVPSFQSQRAALWGFEQLVPLS